jgi:polyisoprenoid-binding protein YceI
MALALILFSIISASAAPVDYKIAPGGQSKISLEVEKTGLYKGKKHQFNFPGFQGKLSFDDQSPANSRVDLKIDAGAIVCLDTWMSPKDKQKVQDYAVNDMLSVSKFPEIRFTSTKVTAKGPNRYEVEGTLTIRGIGKPVVLQAELKPEGMMIEGKSMVKITSYGLKPPSAALGAIGTKDEMTALFSVTAVK